MEIKACPKCGSENLILESRGKLPIMDAQQVALRCADCGRWINMHLIPRIEEAQNREDIEYCQGMLDAFSDFLTDKLYREIVEVSFDVEKQNENNKEKQNENNKERQNESNVKSTDER